MKECGLNAFESVNKLEGYFGCCNIECFWYLRKINREDFFVTENKFWLQSPGLKIKKNKKKQNDDSLLQVGDYGSKNS